MTLKFLLDTPIVSAPVAKQPNLRVAKELEQYGLYCAIAAPVWHELVFGCSLLVPGTRRAALEEYLQTVLLRSFAILAYDEAAATWHGRERARLQDAGKTPPFVDGQIAAIAYTQNLTLVTTNATHFECFAGLEIVDWTR